MVAVMVTEIKLPETKFDGVEIDVNETVESEIVADSISQ